MKNQNPTNDRGLIFNWSAVRRGVFVLTLFLGLSLLGHALGFYLFQVVYPSAASLRIPAARVTLVDLARPENAALRQWIEAESPAILYSSLHPRKNVWETLQPVAHRPSFASASVTMKPLPAYEPPPPEQPPQTPPEIFRHSTAPASPQIIKTLHVSDPQTAPQPLLFSDSHVLLEGSARGTELEDSIPVPLVPAVFMVGVDTRGFVDGVFLMHSSGSREADRAAAVAVGEAQFEAVDEPANTVVHVMFGNPEREDRP